MYDLDNMSDNEINALFHLLRYGGDYSVLPNYCNDIDAVFDFMEEYGAIIDVDGTAIIPKSKSVTFKKYSHKSSNTFRSFVICMIKMMIDQNNLRNGLDLL
jgi:hypothetical protein